MPVLDEFTLEGQVIVVCISNTSDIIYLSEYLLFAGAEVIFWAGTSDLLTEVEKRFGTAINGRVVDLQSREEILESKNHALSRYGQIHGLVVDSRNVLAKPMSEVSDDDWNLVMDSNAKSSFLLYQAFGECMKESGYGRIVNITSELADRSVDNFSVFSASQAAIHSLTKSMTLEYSKYSVRINTIATGWTIPVQTDLAEQQKELLVRFIPLRRKGVPSDLGPLLVFLCSESCDYTTGQPIFINGGLTARP